MLTNNLTHEKITVFNYLRDKRFGNDALTKRQAMEVINNDQICTLMYEHIKNLKEVYNGKCASIKQ